MLEACLSVRMSSISRAWGSPRARAAGSSCTWAIDPFSFGGQEYAAGAELIPVRLDVSRTTGNGWALRLRFAVELEGPCMRCLDPASPEIAVDAFEVQQPGSRDEELTSPYVDDDGELDLAAWARDALALALPGADHLPARLRRALPAVRREPQRRARSRHEAEPDPRWSKLSELRFD